MSDGVPAFRTPEAQNARQVLAALGVILIVLFVGITVLVYAFHVAPVAGETTNSQLARRVFGLSPFYYLVQGVTALILILAANTSFADFPRVASFLARDGFVPRQFANRGDRLAYSNGILILTVLSVGLLVVFHGDTHALIPLYAVGVFLSFTLKQASMVRYWLRRRQRGWVSGVAVQAVGAAATGLVMVIIAVTKFTHGAWIVVVLIPALVVAFVTVRRHYDQVARQLSIDGADSRAAPDRPHRPRARRRRPPGRAPGGALRPGAVRGRARRVRRDHAGADPARRGALGALRGRDAARGAPLPLPLGGRAAPGVPRPPAAAGGGPARHDHPPGVHPRPLVAAPAPQSDGAAHQGRPALPEGRHRHQRALPSRAVEARRVRPEREAHPPGHAHPHGARARHERLGLLTGLAIFASDALSSVAYATEEILLILMLAGSVALGLSRSDRRGHRRRSSLIVVSSYRQTILAYPQGGGSYIVTRENLGRYPSLVAGAALLIDYVLTVAVSVAAGIAAITSAIRPLYPYRVTLCVIGVALIAVGNLRGVRESGRLFALPTYLFLGAYVLLVGWGGLQWLRGAAVAAPPPLPASGGEVLTAFLVLRAFSSGCAALTGIEAVSDGVPAFRPPEAQTARRVLLALGGILIVLFLGISGARARLRRRAGGGGDGELAARPARLRRVAALLLRPGRDDADPRPGREHELRGLPAAGLVPRAGPVHSRASSRTAATGSRSRTGS